MTASLSTLHRRRVVLLDMPWLRDKDPRMAMGQASLLAALRNAGTLEARAVTYPVNSPSFSISEAIALVAEEAQGMDTEAVDLALSVYVWNEYYVKDLLREIPNSGFRGRIFLGGPQITYAPAPVQTLFPDATALVRGFGEEALCALGQNPTPIEHPGVVWQGIEDQGNCTALDFLKLPSPFLSGILEVPTGGFIRWETQRGCPFDCSFCQHPGTNLKGIGHFHRDRIAQEIKLFAARQVSEIAVLDPVFNVGSHGHQVLAMFAVSGFKGRLSLQCRFETLCEETLAFARNLNLRFEFGLQTVIPQEGEAIHRPLRLECIEWGIAQLRQAQIPFEISLIYGLPEQTLESFYSSVQFCLARGVPSIKAFPLMLLRGTQISNERGRWGLLESLDLVPCVIQSHTFGPKEQRQMAAMAAALWNTRGCHPPFNELLKLADRLLAQVDRNPTLPRQQPVGSDENRNLQ